VAIGLVTTAITLGLARLGAWVEPELWIYDHVVGWLAASTPSRYVTVVGITEADLARFGDPVDDATIARALRMAASADAFAVGLDLYRDRSAGNGRADLALVARAYPNVAFV
jgi:adenylate cyclase